jgi:hypothetical protein
MRRQLEPLDAASRICARFLSNFESKPRFTDKQGQYLAFIYA